MTTKTNQTAPTLAGLRLSADGKSLTVPFGTKPERFPAIDFAGERWLAFAGSDTKHGYFADYRRADSQAITAMGSL